MDKTYNVAGYSTRFGIRKARFAKDMERVKVLVRTSHKDILLYTLPEPMTKEDAEAWLKSDAAVQAAEQPFLSQYKQPKPAKAAPAPTTVSAAAIMADPAAAAQAAEEELDVNGIASEDETLNAALEAVAAAAAGEEAAALGEPELHDAHVALYNSIQQEKATATVEVVVEQPAVYTGLTFEEALAQVPMREKGRFIKREVREQMARELMAQ